MTYHQKTGARFENLSAFNNEYSTGRRGSCAMHVKHQNKWADVCTLLLLNSKVSHACLFLLLYLSWVVPSDPVFADTQTDQSLSFVALPNTEERALRSLQSSPGDLASECSLPDVWMVSTRQLPSTCCVPMNPGLRVQHFLAQNTTNGCCRGTWHQSDISSLLGPDAEGQIRPIVIFIHGNRYKHCEAAQQGLTLAQRCIASCAGMGNVRVIIYSWPSEQDGILLKDGRSKYNRAYSEGRYLAWLLGQIKPTRPVGILGYSFGALITLEALEDLVEAEESGRTDLQPWINRVAQTNLMFIAAAVRCDAFAPCGPYRHTLDCVDEVSLIINPKDKVLGFYPMLDCNSKMEALGHTGMPRYWMPENVGLSMTNAERIIGKKHGLMLYLASRSLSNYLCSGATSKLNQP